MTDFLLLRLTVCPQASSVNGCYCRIVGNWTVGNRFCLLLSEVAESRASQKPGDSRTPNNLQRACCFSPSTCDDQHIHGCRHSSRCVGIFYCCWSGFRPHTNILYGYSIHLDDDACMYSTRVGAVTTAGAILTLTHCGHRLDASRIQIQIGACTIATSRL